MAHLVRRENTTRRELKTVLGDYSHSEKRKRNQMRQGSGQRQENLDNILSQESKERINTSRKMKI